MDSRGRIHMSSYGGTNRDSSIETMKNQGLKIHCKDRTEKVC